MSLGLAKSDRSAVVWEDPFCINPSGGAGEDTKSDEFIYRLTAKRNSNDYSDLAPQETSSNPFSRNDWRDANWKDNPQGVSDDVNKQVELVCTRKYRNGS